MYRYVSLDKLFVTESIRISSDFLLTYFHSWFTERSRFAYFQSSSSLLAII